MPILSGPGAYRRGDDWIIGTARRTSASLPELRRRRRRTAARPVPVRRRSGLWAA